MAALNERFYVVHEGILPEALQKTMKAKELLAQGRAKTIHEAVETVGLSRSAFYKYKDGIHALSTMEMTRIVTVSMDLEHRSGLLSKVLGSLAELGGSVLTIHQSMPLQGMAGVVVTVDTSGILDSLEGIVGKLREISGVSSVRITGQGKA